MKRTIPVAEDRGGSACEADRSAPDCRRYECHRVTPESLDRLAKRRAQRPPLAEDAGTFVSRARDAEWER